MIGLDKTLPLLLALCITLLPACTERSRTSLDITEKDAREGDLAFRRGTSRHSRAVGMISTQYSHVGIVVESGGGNLRVVHAVAGEPRFPGDRDSVPAVFTVGCGAHAHKESRRARAAPPKPPRRAKRKAAPRKTAKSLSSIT